MWGKKDKRKLENIVISIIVLKPVCLDKLIQNPTNLKLELNQVFLKKNLSWPGDLGDPAKPGCNQEKTMNFQHTNPSMHLFRNIIELFFI
jgi:hypothetical protein